MTYEKATLAKESGETVAVEYFGCKSAVKFGTILAVKRKLRGGCVKSYATVEWKQATRRGEAQSDVTLARVKSATQYCMGM